MRCKIICIILCFFLIITAFLSNDVKALNEYTTDVEQFYLVNNNNAVLLNALATSSRYNPDTDLLVSGYSTKGDFQSYYIAVLVGGKQYTEGDFKIMCNSGYNYAFYGYNTKTQAKTSLKIYLFQYKSSQWNTWGGLLAGSDAFTHSNASILKTDFVLWSEDEKVVSSKSYFTVPFIANTLEQLENLSVGELAIGNNCYPPSKIVVSLYDNTTDESLFSVSLQDYADYESRLDLDDPFSDLGYVIPWSVLPEFSFISEHSYTIFLNFEQNVPSIQKTFLVSQTINNIDIPSTIRPTPTSVPSPTPEPTPTPDPNQSIIDSNKETQNKLDEQTNAIKEQTETNKNIFQKIGDIFNLLNPLSKDFFVYKLLELLFEGLKSFILPSADFISNFFNELSGWFQERLGFLWTPFDIVNTFLERLNNNTLFVEPIIHIPDIFEPFTGHQLISSTDYNLNSLIQNEKLYNVYNIYLIIVDFIIYLSVITLCYNTLVSVFRGSPDSITISSSGSSADNIIASENITYVTHDK